ncbi:hypothetical protein ACHAXR_006738 [Thalassiosira sp. AJA248-18]
MDGPLSSSRHHHGRSRSRSPRGRHSSHRDQHRRRDRRGGDGRHRRNDNAGGGGNNFDHGRSFRDERHDGNRRVDYYGRGNGRDENSRGKGVGDNGHYVPPVAQPHPQEPPRFRDDNRRDDFGRVGKTKQGSDEYYGRDNGRDSSRRSTGGDFRGDGRNSHEQRNGHEQHAGHYGPPRDGNGGVDGHYGPTPRVQDDRPRGGNSQGPSHLPVKHHYRINPNTRPDERLNELAQPTPENEDPRGEDPTKRITKKAKKVGNGRNTESFDPASTLVRPDFRVWVGSKDKRVFDKKLKHDDVVIVPELFGEECNWDLYYKLVEEMRSLQKENVRDSNWISWHEGAHLISKNPKGSPTFEMVIDRLCEYFNIRKTSIGTRFNWYRDSSDWKPFHHDSAAYNPHRARSQNITVGVSFGATRELALLRATPQENGEKVKCYFPQMNNGVFSFGRDVNILWKHGVNALAEDEQDGKGRISIILWGLADGVKEEAGSPPLLGSDGQGPHAQQKQGGRHGNHGGHGRR